MSSPVFAKSKIFNASPLETPATTAGAGVMTFQNTLTKTLTLFGILLVGAVVGWFLPALLPPAALWITVIGLLVSTLVVGLVAAFKREPSVPLYVAYSVLEGVLIGFISGFFEMLYPGVVIQATLASLVVAGVVFALFASGKVRDTPKLRKFFLVGALSYIVFSLINGVLIWTNVIPSPFGVRGVEIFGIPLGIFIGVFAVILASLALIQDYSFIKNGVDKGLPERYGWTAAYGLMVTIVWLYLEILRILALSRN